MTASRTAQALQSNPARAPENAQDARNEVAECPDTSEAVVDAFGRPVHCWRWTEHVVAKHPKMAQRWEEVRLTISAPAVITRAHAGQDRRHRLCFYRPVEARFSKVVLKRWGRHAAFLITAFRVDRVHPHELVYPGP